MSNPDNEGGFIDVRKESSRTRRTAYSTGQIRRRLPLCGRTSSVDIGSIVG